MSFSHPKLDEAAFFIELFEATQERVESLTRNVSLEEEASFLFSAVLNAFYSAIEQWRSHIKDKAAYHAFVENNPEIYSHSHKGGWRSTTVHVSHVRISYAGYIPPKGGEVNLEFVPPPKLASPKILNDEVDLKFAPYYYVDYRGQRREVAALSREHLSELRDFMEQHSLHSQSDRYHSHDFSSQVN